jgi:hypothetical protein
LNGNLSKGCHFYFLKAAPPPAISVKNPPTGNEPFIKKFTAMPICS